MEPVQGLNLNRRSISGLELEMAVTALMEFLSRSLPQLSAYGSVSKPLFNERTPKTICHISRNPNL
jgi:hypothetical protein